ncbi:MAG TPA: acyltransferase family protein [Solidesulfovibrio magneticus]|nr:acyltransferase family protein [Solidesulfovibrio magneticus]
MRKYFIDNLRWMTVLLVIPYHVFLCYNTFGYEYYVYAVPVPIFSIFDQLCAPWLMPLLFFVSGISTTYALQKRTNRQYLTERLEKLLIPFFSGVILLTPLMAYYARKYYEDYAGGVWDNYLQFFRQWSTGSKGVSPYEVGQMWFLLALCIISLAALPILKLARDGCERLRLERWPLWAVALLFIPLGWAWGLTPSRLQSLAGCFALFLLGGLFFHTDAMQEKLARQAWRLSLPFAALLSAGVALTGRLGPGWWSPYLHALVMWMGILALMGLGRRYLNFTNPVTRYLSASSFALYIFHQAWLVMIAYYAIAAIASPWLQAPVILGLCLACSLATFEACRRLALTRFLFGIKR